MKVIDLEQLPSEELCNLTKNIVDILKERHGYQKSQGNRQTTSLQQDNCKQYFSLVEVSRLVNQLSALKDDSGTNGIAWIDIANKDTVTIGHELFLTEFVNFDIKVLEGTDYPYNLKSNIAGVIFKSTMTAAEIVDLKHSMPEQFEYITQKVQEGCEKGER